MNSRFPLPFRSKIPLLISQLTRRETSGSRYSKSSIYGKDNILRSPHPVSVEPVINATLPEILWTNLSKSKSLPAYECIVTGRKYTYAQLYQLSRGFGTALLQSGLSRNDVVGIVLPNMPEFVIAIMGIWTAGLIASPANPIYTQEELQHQLTSCGAKSVVTSSKCAPLVQKVQERKGSQIKSIIVVTEETLPRGMHSFFDMMKTSANESLLLKSYTGFDARDQVAAIPFSSGTTGPPKGVVLTHSNLATNVLQYTAMAEMRGGTRDTQVRMIGVLPFFHSYGMTALMNYCTLGGAHCVMLPEFQKDAFLKLFQQHKPTMASLVAALMNLIVNTPEFTKKELEHLEVVIIGAAPVGPSLVNRFLEKAGKFILIREGFGMTETSPVVLFAPESSNNKKLGSIGQPVPSTLAKIVDPDTRKVRGPHENGELCLKGPQVMRGYLNNEKATKEAIDQDGWLHTGDIGYFDEDGYVFLVDRMKELIKVKGFQVSPSELEDLLRRIPGVGDCAVIGVNLASKGEAPRAYIVKSEESLTEEKIHAFVKEKAAHYKQLTGGIEFVKSIPKNATGKILRKELKAMYDDTHK